jgi:hypothetical protein
MEALETWRLLDLCGQAQRPDKIEPGVSDFRLKLACQSKSFSPHRIPPRLQQSRQPPAISIGWMVMLFGWWAKIQKKER